MPLPSGSDALGAGPAGTYRLHGLTVRSDFEFPARAVEGEPSVDVTVLRRPSRPVPEDAPPGRRLKGSPTVTAARSSTGELVVRYHGQCEFVFSSDGRQVECSPDPALSEAVVVEKVIRFGMLAALVLGGHLTLHASAVAVDGRAVAFAGPSGSGKSTLAALACRMGARLVTDSVLRVASSGWCFTGPSELRLRPPADILGQGAAVIGRRGVAIDERVAVEYRQPPHDTVMLAGIVLPVLDADAQGVVVQQLHGARAAVALTPVLRHWFCQDPDLYAHHLRELAAVVEKVPVWRCVIPLTPPLEPAYVRLLLGQVGVGI